MLTALCSTVVHEDSTMDVSVLEAFPLDQIDPNRAKAGVDSFTKKLAAARNEMEAAKAQIGLEVHEAMVYALEHAKSG